MSSIRNLLHVRLRQPNAFTIKVRFSSTGKTTEYALCEALNDGFIGQAIGQTRSSREWVRYGALDRVRILEEGDV